MARRTKEESEKTRALLLDAAEQLFLDKGVNATSLDDIAKYAGMTRGAVYWHFKNKMDLFEAMRLRVKMPMTELFERAVNSNEPLEELKKSCIESMRKLAEDEHTKRVYTIMLLRYEQIDGEDCMQRLCKGREESIERLKKTFKRAKFLGHLEKNINPNDAAYALHGLVVGIYIDYLRDTSIYNIVSTAPKMMELFFRGLTSRQKNTPRANPQKRVG